MNQDYYFKNARWIGAQERTTETFSVIRGRFEASDAKKVTFRVLGLGFFKCYINGVCMNPDTFLPLSSDFEDTCDPVDEVISAHRIYVPEFDITPFVQNGENIISIHFGGGWYCFENRPFGLPIAIYNITVKDANGETDFVSNENCKVGKSFVTDYHFTFGENRDYSNWEDCFDKDFDDSLWENAVVTEQL